MPDFTQFCISLILVALYLLAILGIYARLRRAGYSFATSTALSVPTTQAAFSAIFQARFLLSSPHFGVLCSIAFLAWATTMIYAERTNLRNDRVSFIQRLKEYRWITVPLCAVFAYTFLQVMLLPITNIDALTYHLPRVWLFIQNNTFFLDHYTRYHEVVFPVGYDVLLYPFLTLETPYGIGIFSLSSYASIGAAAYSVARKYESTKVATLTALICLSLTEVVLQAASVKNDIIMANVAMVTVMLALRFDSKTSYRTLLYWLLLCTFGISTKTTFIAFLPGLFSLAVLKLQVWQQPTFVRLFCELKESSKLTISSIIPLFILSQLWLFAWNHHYYGSWSGPETFTHRNQQHDGIKGAAANSLRYGIQAIQGGSLTNNYIAPKLGLKEPESYINDFYYDHTYPSIGNLGATRELFEVNWSMHEDFAWFGPLGAFMLFVCLPYFLIRNPKQSSEIIPACAYFIALCVLISWMPWNGRFMTTFFITLAPALAHFLSTFRAKYLYIGLTLTAITSLLTVKLTDYHRPLLATEAIVDEGGELSLSHIFHESFIQHKNAWSAAYMHSTAGHGNPPELLQSIPEGARVAFIGHGTVGHFNFFIARPDIKWVPLDGNLATGLITQSQSLNLFFKSDLSHCVIIGDYPSIISRRYSLHSPDGYGHLITKAPNGRPHIVNLIETTDLPE